MKSVIKFGGTCFGNKNKYKWILDNITSNYINKNIKPIIVVSAISRDSKDSGTTSNLLNLLHKSDYCYLEKIRTDHLSIIDDLELTSDKSLERTILDDFEKIETFSDIGQTVPVSILEENIIKIGERMSSKILHSYFVNNNINNSYLNLENIICNKMLQNEKDIYNDKILNSLKNIMSTEEKDSIITGGYLGSWNSYNGILNVLDRGYSDYTAAMISSAINADKFEVYKESSCIFTLNPAKYKNANIVKNMTYNDLIVLTYCGNEALNKHASEILKKYNIPITIRNAFSNTIEKTEINRYRHDDTIVALTDKDCAVATIDTTEGNIFRKLEKICKNNEVFAYNYNFGKLTIITDPHYREHFNEIVNKDKKIISIIGNFIQNKVGVSRDIFRIVAESNVNIDNIIQTHNHNHMSFVIDSKHSDKVMKNLNKNLF